MDSSFILRSCNILPLQGAYVDIVRRMFTYTQIYALNMLKVVVFHETRFKVHFEKKYARKYGQKQLFRDVLLEMISDLN